jgi:hypothetical protein
LAATNNAPLVASELGHTTSQLVYQHYRELVTPEQAKHYWNIAPGAEAANVVAFNAELFETVSGARLKELKESGDHLKSFKGDRPSVAKPVEPLPTVSAAACIAPHVKRSKPTVRRYLKS